MFSTLSFDRHFRTALVLTVLFLFLTLVLLPNLIAKTAFSATTNLIAAYNFDEATGTTLNDLSGNAHQGTLMKSPVWGAGHSGSGLTFSSAKNYVTMGDVSQLDGLTNISVEVWEKSTGTGEMHFVDKSACTGNTNDGPFELGANFFTGGKAAFVIYKNGGSYSSVESSAKVNDGVWHHIAGTYDGTSLKIYVDGVLSGTTAVAGYTMSSTANVLELGGYCSGASYALIGSLDDVRLYSRALSLAEVQADMVTPVGGTPPPPDTQAPSVPTNLVATVISAAQINLTWSTSTDNVAVAGYKVFRNGVQTATTTAGTYNNTGLTASTTYTYAVAAYDAAGNVSLQSGSVSANTLSVPDTTVPSTPLNLAASPVSAAQINLSWSASTDNVGVVNYRVFRCLGTSCTATLQVGTSTTTIFTDTGLAVSTSYNYRIRAADAAGNLSAYSAAKSAKTLTAPDTSAPSVPINLTGVSTTTSAASLSWTPSTDNVAVAGYKVFRNGVQTATVTSSNYYDSGLVSATSYSYAVSAYDAAGNESALSAISVVTTTAPDTQAPSVPTNLVATVISAAQINLTWSTSTDNVAVAGYKVFRNGVQTATTTAGTYNNTGLTASTTYTYAVAAYDAAGNVSLQSGSVSGVTSGTQSGTPFLTGLDFPSNGDVPSDAFVAFQFSDPQNNGLPIWGPNDNGTTYVWKYKPRQQPGYYVTMWWSNNGNFTWDGGSSNTFYGAHPYPRGGGNTTLAHDWEIATDRGGDYITTRSGSSKSVVNDNWYTQALRVTKNPNGTKTLIFYTALPSTAPQDVIEVTVPANYGEINPPFPALTFGDSPWYATYQHERLSGVLRGIKVFNKVLSENDTVAESAADSLVTPDGAANIWYMNINPTPDDISDKSGKGHNPAWASATHAGLYSEGTAPADVTAPTIPSALGVTGSSSTQINLTWAPSTDNVAVAGYQIYRNSTAIGTSTVTAFTDSNLASGNTYTYTVSSFDAAGNTSAQSMSALGITPALPGMYVTNFPLSENPLSEGGKWTQGKAVGLDWNNPLSAGGKVYASILSGATGSRYDDSVAVLNTAYAADQYAQGVVYRASGYPTSTTVGHEVELLLRFSITPHDARGYEVMWGYPGYLAIARWNGPAGSYTSLFPTDTIAIGAPVDNDVLRAEIVGNTIKVYKNGVFVASVTDTTYTSGQPGIGFWPVDGATPQNYGWKSYTAGAFTSDTQAPSIPLNLTAVATSTQISLNWSASTDNVAVAGYQIYRGGAQIALTSGTSFVDSNLATSTTYTYSVAATDGSGNVSAQSTPASATTSGSLAPSGVVIAYNFDQSSGTVLTDLSGNSLPGTLVGSPTWAAGHSGNALTFTGANYVTMGNISTLNSLSAMTVEAWVKTTDTTEKHFIDKSACDGVTNGGPFEFGANLFSAGKLALVIYRSGGNPSYVGAESSVSVNNGAWHHVAGTYDGTTIKVYVDGVLSGSTAAAGYKLSSNTNALELAGHCNNNSYLLKGSLDDVRVYNRALSAAEVVIDMNKPVGQ